MVPGRRIRRGPWRRALAAAALAGLAGCSGIVQESFTQRCADLMKESYPGGGDIAVTAASAALDKNATNITSMIATVRGTRRDVPKGGFVAREVAAECRFDNGVLTSFHWTKGPFR